MTRALKAAGLLVGLLTIGVGIVGLVSPDTGTAVRRLYFATSGGLYAAGAIRMVMGVVIILCAPASRSPRILRVLGAMMCLQALAATVMGPDHARAILEWENQQGNAVLRLGALVALAAGVFIAFAIIAPRRNVP
jgi:hypothetical protein